MDNIILLKDWRLFEHVDAIHIGLGILQGKYELRWKWKKQVWITPYIHFSEINNFMSFNIVFFEKRIQHITVLSFLNFSQYNVTVHVLRGFFLFTPVEFYTIDLANKILYAALEKSVRKPEANQYATGKPNKIIPLGLVK